MVISTIPTKKDNILLIKTAKRENKDIAIFVAGGQIKEALDLYDAGGLCYPAPFPGRTASFFADRGLHRRHKQDDRAQTKSYQRVKGKA